jgi:tRNA (uracil-5-)-methyltransferase TRM9
VNRAQLLRILICRSLNLAKIVRDRKFEVNVSDCLDIPVSYGRFVKYFVFYLSFNSIQDFAISIAVIHHLSTQVRRVAGVRAVLDTLTKDGKALIYVWALEQKSSRRGWDETSKQDVMVPWTTRTGSGEITYKRYYHLFRKGELEDCVLKAGGQVLEGGYEKVSCH